jgi:hypothetical protein
MEDWGKRQSTIDKKIFKLNEEMGNTMNLKEGYPLFSMNKPLVSHPMLVTVPLFFPILRKFHPTSTSLHTLSVKLRLH